MKVWTDSTASGQDPMAGSSEHGNEPSDFINGRNFLTGEQL